MSKSFVIGIAAAVTAILSVGYAISNFEKVPAGNVGVRAYLLGGNKGVDNEVLTPGRYFIGINEELYLFPTFTQNYTWQLAPDDTGDEDESISFQTVEGLSVNADIGISYSVDPTKVSTIFQKYRKGVDEITDIYLRNMVRDALVTAGSTRAIDSVYGAGKADLIAEVEKNVRAQVASIGINIERVYWIGQLRLPQGVLNALNAKVAATQMAQQRENEVAQAKAEADKKVEEARGQAESQLLVAEAEAKAIRIKGEALRENQRLVELTIAEKWDGKLPTNMYGSAPVPFINVPNN